MAMEAVDSTSVGPQGNIVRTTGYAGVLLKQGETGEMGGRERKKDQTEEGERGGGLEE